MKLKPCPFCGSEDLSKIIRGQPWVECLNCGATGPDPLHGWNSRAQHDVIIAAAKDVWNDRHEST